MFLSPFFAVIVMGVGCMILSAKLLLLVSGTPLDEGDPPVVEMLILEFKTLPGLTHIGIFTKIWLPTIVASKGAEFSGDNTKLVIVLALLPSPLENGKGYSIDASSVEYIPVFCLEILIAYALSGIALFLWEVQ